MVLAVHRRLALNIEAHLLGAGVTSRALCGKVQRIALGISLAIHRRLAACKVETRSFDAGVMWATPTANDHYAVGGMLLAVRCRLDALKVEARPLGA